MSETQEQQKPPVVNASCMRCRQSKLKCIRSEDDEKCTRCRQSGSECSDVPRAIRRRKTRTDARVAHLENELQKVKDLLLHAGEGSPPAVELTTQRRFIFQEPLTPGSQSSGSTRGRASVSFKEDAIVSRTPPSTVSQNSEHESTFSMPGIVPDIITAQQAGVLLTTFRQRTVNQLPVVQLEDRDTLETLLSSKPMLLLAMITAASNAEDPTTFQRLHAELIRRLAQKAIIEGERGIELVQAVLVMETWLWLPENLQNVNFYQWIHIAATMALQIGLGGNGKGKSRARQEELNSTVDMEELRTTLSVYLSASSVAISLRRDNMYGLTPAVRMALDAFSKRAETTNDQRLLAWIRLEMIAEDVQSVTPDQQHSRESFLAMSSDVAANVYRLHIRLENWKQELQPGIINEMLFVHFQYCKAKLYEIPVHFHHDLSKLVAYPFTGGDLKPAKEASNGSDGDQILRRAVQPYHDACRGVLHAVLAISPDVLGGCPTVLLARAVYAMNGLKIGQTRGSLTEDLRSILDLVAKHMAKAVGDLGRQVPRAFLKAWDGLLDNPADAKQSIKKEETEHRALSVLQISEAYGTPSSSSQIAQSTPGSESGVGSASNLDTTFQLDQSMNVTDGMILDSDLFSDAWLTDFDPALEEFVAGLEMGDLPKCPWQQWQDALDSGQISSID